MDPTLFRWAFRVFRRARVLVALFVIAPLHAAELSQSAHPNHYILLVDASGSTRSTPTKTATLRTAVQSMLDQLYSGFKDAGGTIVVPAFDPAHDVVSVEHFGIVEHEQDSASAYLRLRGISFEDELVKPLLIREPNVSRQRLQQLVFPTRYYDLTLLSWVKQLAVIAVKPSTDSAEANRTFLVFVTDMLPNETTLRDETALVRNHGTSERVDDAEELVADFDNAYRIGNGRGQNKPAWRRTFGDEDESTTVEVWEIASKHVETWVQNATAVEQVGIASFEWTSSNDGVLNITPSAGLHQVILSRLEGPVTVQSPNGTTIWASGTPLQLQLDGIRCDPAPATIQLSGTTRHVDPMLGVQRYSFATSGQFALPEPNSCGLPFRLGVLAAVVLMTLSVIIAAVYYRMTRGKAHVVAHKMVSARSWTLQWNQAVTLPGVIEPSEQEVMTVEMPRGWKRILLYRTAVLILTSTPSDQFQWNDTGKDTMRVLDLGKTATVRRRPGAKQVAKLQIELHRRESRAIYRAQPGASNA